MEMQDNERVNDGIVIAIIIYVIRYGILVEYSQLKQVGF